MKLEKFAAVIFIEAAILSALLVRIRIRSGITRRVAAIGTVRAGAACRNALGLLRIRSDTQPVVEIEQHRGTLRGRDQQILELAHGMRANCVLLVVSEQHAIRALVDEHIEVVKPEIGHHFVELALAVNRAQQLGLNEFVGDHALRIVHGQQCFSLLGIEAGQEVLTFAAAQ